MTTLAPGEPGERELNLYHATYWEALPGVTSDRWECTARWDLTETEACNALKRREPVYRIQYRDEPTLAAGRATCRRHATTTLWALLTPPNLDPAALLAPRDGKPFAAQHPAAVPE